MKQKTIAGAVRLSGKGLHFGKESTLTVMPAEPNTGYLFVRTDLDGCPHIRAIADNVNETSRGTTVTENGVSVSTIEHLMAATYAMGIDNAEFRVDGPEVPILDGSSRYYVEAFSKVGTKEQDVELKVLNLDEPVSFTNGDTEITLADFPSEIANCRTFVFLSEIEPLLKMNLIKGGDLDNAIVVVDKVLPQSEYDRIAALCGKESIKVQESGILNTLKLQFDNEPARHKLLDIIGDLALCGFRFNARIEAVRPGHFANTQLSKKLRQYFLQKR